MDRPQITLHSQEIEITSIVRPTQRQFFKDIKKYDRIGIATQIPQLGTKYDRPIATSLTLFNLTQQATGTCTLNVISRALQSFGYVIIHSTQGT